MNNLYWAVYQNLESELLDIANTIHMDDNQLNVYSVRIADLLVRTVIEIESISKQLYEQFGGEMVPKDSEGKPRTLYFDTDCLQLLEEKWEISKKTVIVSGTMFFFQREENKYLSPLRKSYNRGSSGADWKRAYQAVKHERYNNLKQGNLKNLIRSMAALYLLNIYNSDKTFAGQEFDSRVGSRIFSIDVAYAIRGINTHMSDNVIMWTGSPREQAMYIEKYTEREIRKWHRQYCTLRHSLNKSIDENEELQEAAKDDYDLFHSDIVTITGKLVKNPLWAKHVIKAINEADMERGKKPIEYENVVNKNQEIYPELKWEDVYPGESEMPRSLIVD